MLDTRRIKSSTAKIIQQLIIAKFSKEGRVSNKHQIETPRGIITSYRFNQDLQEIKPEHKAHRKSKARK